MFDKNVVLLTKVFCRILHLWLVHACDDIPYTAFFGSAYVEEDF